MKIGVLMYPVEGGVVDVARFARRAEELGFESVWAPEHTIVPVTSETPAPLGYDNIPDPIVALGVACGATTTLLLGTAVCLVPEHDPILLAKQVATLDRQSGGRFLLGIGVGWLREESEILGGDFPRRWTQARGEAVAAMKALWTQDVAEFHGRYYEFPPVWCYPKPAQQPHPPVILGSKSANDGPRENRCLERLSAEFDGMYSKVGRASVPPERLLKASLLICLYSVRSERAFCEELEYNLLFRWFLDMNLMERSFDPTVFTKNRRRLLEHRIGQALFDEVAVEADRQGLLSAEHFSVDGTLIEAAASIKSFRRRDEGQQPPDGPRQSIGGLSWRAQEQRDTSEQDGP